MILFLDILSFVFSCAYAFVFFSIINIFLKLRTNLFVRGIGFVVCGIICNTVIYSNDLHGLFGAMLFFLFYLLLFYHGKFMQKISALLVFYPVLIAVNYLTQDVGSRLFFGITNATNEQVRESYKLALTSSFIYTTSLLFRLGFWVGTWFVFRKMVFQRLSYLTTKTWLIIDMLMGASSIAIVTIIYFLPENMMITYPICGASIFSSFGGMYLASYICSAVETAYQTKELEKQRNYYKERMLEEERIRSIYHDMKNHLLVLKSKASGDVETEKMMDSLQAQMKEYENYVHTGNIVLDIILRDKACVAKANGIDFTALANFEEGGFIEPLDISTIFGNALDNAIEASIKLLVEQRLITVKAKRVHDMISIVFENNAPKSDNTELYTSKKDSLWHGFGLSNMKKAVQKYGGQCTVKQENGMFFLNIIIPIP